MNDILFFYLNGFWRTTFIIFIALVFRYFLKNTSKKYTTIIWNFVIFNMLFPLKITFLLDNFTKQNSETGDIQALPREISGILNNRTIEITEKVSVNKWTIFGIVSKIYLIGILVLFTITIIQFIHFRIQIKKHAEKRKNTNIYIWNKKFPACTYGIIKPIILLPSGISLNDEKKVIQHEYVHIKRHDNVFLLLVHVAYILNWYNPFCYIVYQIIKNDIEEACDEEVVQMENTDFRKEYAKALISLSTFRMFGNFSGIEFGKNNLKRRIIRIGKNYKISKKLQIIIIACFIGISFFITFEPVRIHVNKNISELEVGADIPAIAHIDDKKIILYDHQGIYVYSMDKKALVYYLDTKEIGFTMSQGDNATMLEVSKNGTKCYIFQALERNKGYLLDLRDYSLREYNGEIKDIAVMERANELNVSYEGEIFRPIYLYQGKNYFLTMTSPQIPMKLSNIYLVVLSEKQVKEYKIFE